MIRNRQLSCKLNTISQGRAFTLIEMLLALVLSALVLTTAAQVTVQTLRTEQSIDSSLLDNREVEYPLEAIDEDLKARLMEGEAVTARLDANHRPQIEFDCLAVESTPELHLPRVPTHVTYRLLRSPVVIGNLRLIRETKSLVDHNPIRKNILTDSLESFKVRTFVSGKWIPLHDKSNRNNTQIEALEITCKWANNDKETTRICLLTNSLPGGIHGKR